MGARVHTVIVSDLHLTEAELGRPGKSLWKRYKRPKFFIDQSFKRFMQYVQAETTEIDPGAKMELVLNGDIFDFDAVMKLPLHTRFHISWLEKRRGLYPEEEKSCFKMQIILSEHSVWIQSLREFIQHGNSVVFVIGNHDIELHWPAVQKEVIQFLKLTPEEEQRVRFCEWFYVSEQDTTIEHGNQYDDYCVINPIHPLIKKGKKIQVRIPFGDITNRYMVNGMGLFNPHAESSFLMSLPEYFKFFYKYSMRVHPTLFWTWLWSSSTSFVVALGDGLLPAMRDPLYIEQRVEEIGRKSNASPQMVRTLRELHTHAAIFNPIKIARELWLDRFILLSLVGFISFEAIVHLRATGAVISWIWFFLFFVLLTPLLYFYSRDITSEVANSTGEALKQAPLIAQVTKTKRVVFGHTHREMHTFVDSTEVLNTGTWSPAFKDPECREPFTKRCFAWIRAENGEDSRVAKLYYWKDPGIDPVPMRK